jgi:hypothetical protein
MSQGLRVLVLLLMLIATHVAPISVLLARRFCSTAPAIVVGRLNTVPYMRSDGHVCKLHLIVRQSDRIVSTSESRLLGGDAPTLLGSVLAPATSDQLEHPLSLQARIRALTLPDTPRLNCR